MGLAPTTLVLLCRSYCAGPAAPVLQGWYCGNRHFEFGRFQVTDTVIREEFADDFYTSSLSTKFWWFSPPRSGSFRVRA